MTAPTLKDIFELAALLIKNAREKGLTVGTAESCTGGLIGAAITAIPKSSRVYEGSFVVYSNTQKVTLLDISKDILDQHGAVSREVAHDLALNARAKLGVDIAISVTGIAGPGGGTAEKPVGTVWMGVAQRGANDEVIVRTELFEFGAPGRNKVRDYTCFEALKALNHAVTEL